ncbi:Gfo/Idh/MocA family protein [Vibrio penaeicida]|uniref:Gfo/Idh/MocA family protein n=1 Tax=Vibrio penaeicida TaxID=104609 RepID=UPI000CE9E536|nr:Gfo/Idh/MocA family oxidoreductase [Vibrio penaeicida]
MIRLGIIGSGRMGKIYASAISDHCDATVGAIVSRNINNASALCQQFGGMPFDDVRSALLKSDLDAVIICSPTRFHSEHIEVCCDFALPILCEKPIDIHVDKVQAVATRVVQSGIPFMVGFNRRFDPQVFELQTQIKKGRLGRLRMLLLTSRDPSPPTLDYLKLSGGYFCDSTIHDIDLACWITGEKPISVNSVGSTLFNKDIASIGDKDTTMTLLKMPSGTLVHINNCRECRYGFDQRIEVFGDKGMLQTTNQTETCLLVSNNQNYQSSSLLKHFFLERYQRSFVLQLDDFIQSVNNHTPISTTLKDGLNALIIAQACQQSSEINQWVTPHYDEQKMVMNKK